jgi:hypothetical protein
MPLPTFAASTMSRARSVTLTRTQAAGRPGFHPGGVDKLVRAGILDVPITAIAVDELTGREPLQVIEGELTVLRTDARADVPRRGQAVHRIPR